MCFTSLAELLNRHYNTDDHWLCAHNGKGVRLPVHRQALRHQPHRLPRILDIGGLKPWEVGHWTP
jgi:hypothetical protein